jgi:hypothetical protein
VDHAVELRWVRRTGGAARRELLEELGRDDLRLGPGGDLPDADQDLGT